MVVTKPYPSSRWFEASWCPLGLLALLGANGRSAAGVEVGRRGGRTRAHRTFPMLVQLPDIQPDVVDRGVDLGTPLLKGCGHTLDGGDARLLRDGEVAESALPLVVLLGDTRLDPRFEIVETLGQLVEDKLGVGIHGSLAALESCEVVVGRTML